MVPSRDWSRAGTTLRGLQKELCLLLTCGFYRPCPLNGVCHNHGILMQELLHAFTYSFVREFGGFNFKA